MPSLNGFIYQGTKSLVKRSEGYGKYFYHIRLQGKITTICASKAIYPDKESAEAAAVRKINSGELDDAKNTN